MIDLIMRRFNIADKKTLYQCTSLPPHRIQLIYFLQSKKKLIKSEHTNYDLKYSHYVYISRSTGVFRGAL